MEFNCKTLSRIILTRRMRLYPDEPLAITELQYYPHTPDSRFYAILDSTSVKS